MHFVACVEVAVFQTEENEAGDVFSPRLSFVRASERTTEAKKRSAKERSRKVSWGVVDTRVFLQDGCSCELSRHNEPDAEIANQRASGRALTTVQSSEFLGA